MKQSARLDPPTAKGREDNTIDALVLNCMDYRFVDSVARYLDARGLHNRYDQVMLAGAAIGITADDNAAWANTFWEHVALAKSLHGISKIIVIDHRDCGACKAFIGPDCADDPEKERAVHARVLNQLADEARRRHPGLEVELLLMDLDGSIEEIERSEVGW